MKDQDRFTREREFHDRWATSAESDLPDPRHVNEALTSPELRHIHRTLAPVAGKKVMDLGCGLGEASVYFAICGAKVTSVDLSQEMVRTTALLAKKNGVEITPHVAAAEDLGFSPSEKFDIVYVGNLFHHVDIKATLDKVMPHLASDGVLVSWDPLAYNPIINVYRSIATEVRTVDEHPLTVSDIRLIRSRFGQTQVKFYWLTSLLIFILMAVLQRKNPNKVRYWKAVVDDSDKWAWLFKPLSFVDSVLLKLFPPLGWLCWNVVVVAKNPLKVPANV